MEEYILTVFIQCEDKNNELIEKTLHSLNVKESIEIININSSHFHKENMKTVCNSNIRVAIDQAIQMSKGKYLLFISAGDYFYENSLEKVITELKKEKYDVLNCNYFDHHNLYQIQSAYKKNEKKTYCSKDLNILPTKLKGTFIKRKLLKNITLPVQLDNSFELEILSQMIHNDQLDCLRLSGCVVAYRDGSDMIPFDESQVYSHFFDIVKSETQLNIYQQYYLLIEIKKYLTKKVIKYHKENLNDDEKNQYLRVMKNVLSHISLDTLLQIDSIIMPYKNYLLKLKLGDTYYAQLYIDNFQMNKKQIPFIVYDKTPLFDLTKVGNFKINILESKNNVLMLDGIHIFGFLGENYKLSAIDKKGNVYKPQVYKWPLADKEGFIGENISETRRFKFEIPLNGVTHLRFCITSSDGGEFKLIPSFGNKYAKLVKKYKMSYYAKDDYIFRYRNQGLSITKRNWKNHLKAEIKFMLQLAKLKKYNIIFLRTMYYLSSVFKTKPIWLIRDNEKRAKDSGAEMFKYYKNWELKNKVNAYFILDSHCPDYQVLKTYGKIIQPDSFKYKLYHLLADKLIDTRGGISAQYIFKNDANCVLDLCHWDYIWLIHGIMTRNESTWTNKYVLNAKLFATCNEREYQSVLDEKNGYGYDKDEVALTGLPRHDALYAHKKKNILFLPTWRKHLAGDLIPGTSDRSYVDNFKETDFFQFYNRLINDSRLLRVMKEKGYTGDFYLHPSFMKQCNDFQENPIIRVGKGPADTNELIGQCSILITDYSSAQFEGAYLDTPVIYPQYDADTFGENHTGKDGYFDYEKDGFGPVCYDLDSTVKAIIEYIENDCQNKEPYKSRAQDFFVHRDQNNCKRVYDQIMKIDGYTNHDIQISSDKENVYLYKDEKLVNAVTHEDVYKLYNPLFHLTSYVKKIVMKEKGFSIDAWMILDEKDYHLPHYNFAINIGPYVRKLEWKETFQRKGRKHFRFQINIPYSEILLTKKSTPIFIIWEDENGYGFRNYLKYQYVERNDTLANRSHRQLHNSDVCILKDIQSSIFVRETMGNNVYLCVRDINVTDYPKEQKKLKRAYLFSKIFWFHKARKSTLCFEKFASKYEESASVLFEKIVNEGNRNTYFIIDKDSIHYSNIPQKYRRYIIPKYSFKHYFYFFMSKMFISTESMNHIIELNICDSHVTLKITKGEYDYIFLQHGVMYMYCLENRTDFIKGAGFTKNSKVVVSSQTEANHFIEYGQFEQNDLIISGLPKFDRNKHNPNADKILIMPTSRDFEYNVIRLTPTESTYYKFVKNIIQSIPKELHSKIVVVGHPLLKKQLDSTDLKEYMPNDYIYNELLEETKLLITDYSSISYDAFYRGCNVIFCWEDKELCLNSLGYKLMLNDKNVFADVSYSFDDLPNLVHQNYYSSQSDEHVQKYRDIVTYHDNQNTQRCYQSLVDFEYYGKKHRRNIAKLQIKYLTKKVYSGERRIHTKLELHDKNKMLVKNRDYKVYYFNNKRKTRFAIALLVGKGYYYGIKLKHFRICDSILNYEVRGIRFVNNMINTDYISVRNCKNHYLRKNIDYTLEIEEGPVAKTIQLTIQGKKKYAGKKVFLYKIENNSEKD